MGEQIQSANSYPAIPLCVDLDGTLIRGDSLHELCARLLKYKPLSALALPFWLLGGIANLKRKLSAAVGGRVEKIPFNGDVLAFLFAERRKGRSIYLTTACERNLAAKLAAQVCDPETKAPVFAGVFGSQDGNLKGRAKAALLVEKFGEKGFDYIGDSAADFPVWAAARRQWVVDTSPRFARRVCARFGDSAGAILQAHRPSLRAALKELRVHQTVKNLLVFVPLFLGHKYGEPTAILLSVAAFVAFGLCAMGTYLWNDLLDVENDRRHLSKKYRPMAWGTFPVAWGLVGAPLLTVLAFALAVCVNGAFFLTLLAYAALTVSYSSVLKRFAVVDVLALALLYLMRIVGGGAAAEIEISFWLLSFSLFIFLSLAVLKRYVEVKTRQSAAGASGRDYRAEDLPMLAATGVAAGMMSVLLYTLYIDRSAQLYYAHPQYLLFGSVLFLYFICKIWLKAGRDEVNQDPIVHAIKTKENYVLIAVFLVLFVLASPIAR